LTLLLSLVSAFWILVGVAWAVQRHISALILDEASSLGGQLSYALWASGPWIPVSLGIIEMGRRFPFRPGDWKRPLAVHLVGAAGTALIANILMTFTRSWSTGGAAVPERWLTTAFSGAAAWVHVITLLYFSVVGAISVLQYREHVQRRELALARQEADVADARLLTLTAPLRPHFLLNVLHGIGQLWRSGRSAEADRMLEGLGDLFRGVLEQSDRREIPLSDEIALVERYLALEQVRFADRLTAEIRVAPGTEAAAVPSLILQPLVENAVRHGVGARRSAATITVEVRREDAALVAEVRDDGPGPDTGSPDPGQGVGLANVRARLEHLYGDDQSLELRGRPEGGTVARIRLPFRPHAADDSGAPPPGGVHP